MLKLQITLSESKLSPLDIENFQSQFNYSLPQNVIKLISKFNGGLIKNSDDVRKLLPIKYGKLTIEELIDTHQISEQNIPQGFLPIALDYSDNPIAINLNEGEDYCKIFLFELDFEGEGFIIANSLEELLGVNSIDEL